MAPVHKELGRVFILTTLHVETFETKIITKLYISQASTYN